MDRLNIVVLSCEDLGVEVANRLSRLPSVRQVTLVQAPWSRRQAKKRFLPRLRHLVRMEGPWAPASALVRRLRSLTRLGVSSSGEPGQMRLDEQIRLVSVANFHDEDALAALKSADADLGVVAGTYLLKKKVFAAPKLGSINLHSGKAPEYRGSAPAFWELYNGESTVGVTVHRVTRKLDAGNILAQESFSLDVAPSGDPIDYIESYRRDVLRPNGVRMLAEVVDAIARGEAVEVPQDPSRSFAYRSPDYRTQKALRRRVARRRASQRRGAQT